LIKFSDYHTHTLYSNHGQGHPRELAAYAISQGLTALGFSEHFPLPAEVLEPSGATSNMHWDQIDHYIQEVREVQAEFGQQIKILLGYEVDYLPDFNTAMQDNLAQYPADYYVGSIHIVDHFRSNHMQWLIDYTPEIFEEGLNENGGIEAVYIRYYQLIRDFAQSFSHQIVGHLDLVKKFNFQQRHFDPNSTHYLSQVEATLDVLKATGKIVEINTAGLFKGVGELYPADPILQMMLERRLPICLSSDAHKPEHVAREFSSTWQKLIKLGFEQLTNL
jgi:histidinol-phosphatase (PHP family)